MNPVILTHADVLRLLPDRKADAHKGDFGRVLLLCGSRGYTGAPALAALGALRSGAGLIFLGVPESIYAIEAARLLEPIVFPLPDQDGKLAAASLPEILSRLPHMDACLIGPGLGQSEEAALVVQTVLQEARCPVVLDADGINLMLAHKDVLRERTYPTILTPHEGEFLRFGGSLAAGRLPGALDMARDLGAIVLLKGHRTLITDGFRLFENHTGNPGMAKGGSGDVLAGILVSLLGQGLPPLEAAACAAFVHGAAGDLCAAQTGQYGMTPSDLVEALPRLLK